MDYLKQKVLCVHAVVHCVLRFACRPSQTNRGDWYIIGNKTALRRYMADRYRDETEENVGGI
jgi:hypothetical protein